MRLAKASIEMPRMTPGITSGASINTDNACLPGKLLRSRRKAFTVPKPTASSVTPPATLALAYNNRGIVLKDMKRLNEALASYDRAIELRPNYHEARSNRDVALKLLRGLDEALAACERAVAAAPVIFYQLWAFISPGLYSKEKRLVIPFVLFSTTLFLSGVAFGYYLAFPITLNYFFSLLGPISTGGAVLTQRTTFESYLDFSTRMLVAFGGVFELPLFIAFLAIAGTFYLMSGRYIASDDSYVHANKLMVSTDVSGLVKTVNVHEGQSVKANEILFTLDPLPAIELAQLFVEMREPATRCRFDDCRHLAEPDCAVREAVAEGRIAASRYESYRELATAPGLPSGRVF